MSMVSISSKDLERLTHRQCILFAIFCCYQRKKPHDRCDLLVIKVVEKWLKGEATAEDCRIMGRIALEANNDSYICFLAYATSENAQYAAMSAGLIADNVSVHYSLTQARWRWLEKYSEVHIMQEVLKTPER